jgi:hypothetical protein
VRKICPAPLQLPTGDSVADPGTPTGLSTGPPPWIHLIPIINAIIGQLPLPP